MDNISSDLSSILPLWRDDSESTAMIKLSLDIVKNAVAYLTLRQTPVLAFHRALYALANKIQWHDADTYGQLVTMMGPLHTEMVFMNTFGDLLKDSGWTTIVTNAQEASSGVTKLLVLGDGVVQPKYRLKYHHLHSISFSNRTTWTDKKVKQDLLSLNGAVLSDEREKPKFLVWVNCYENGACPVSDPPVSS